MEQGKLMLYIIQILKVLYPTPSAFETKGTDLELVLINVKSTFT